MVLLMVLADVIVKQFGAGRTGMPMTPEPTKAWQQRPLGRRTLWDVDVEPAISEDLAELMNRVARHAEIALAPTLSTLQTAIDAERFARGAQIDLEALGRVLTRGAELVVLRAITDAEPASSAAGARPDSASLVESPADPASDALATQMGVTPLPLAERPVTWGDLGRGATLATTWAAYLCGAGLLTYYVVELWAHFPTAVETVVGGLVVAVMSPLLPRRVHPGRWLAGYGEDDRQLS